jgi:hypothetical protein
MKNNFSFRRIGLMLKADWIEYKKVFSIFAVLLLAINLFLLRNVSNGIQVFLFCVSFFNALTFFYYYVGWKVHRSKNRFLTLPSSAIEKFVEILFVGFVFFCVFILIHTILLGISNLIYGTQIWFLRDVSRDAGSEVIVFSQSISMILFICTFLLMCCFMFRKYPLPLGTLILILYGLVCVYTVYIFVRIDNMENFNTFGGLIHSNAFMETVIFITKYNMVGLCAASAVLLYISFLKLKEKQIR